MKFLKIEKKPNLNSIKLEGFLEGISPDKMYKVANLDSVSIEEKVLDLLNSNIVLKKQN